MSEMSKRTLFFGILVTLLTTSGPNRATDRTGAHDPDRTCSARRLGQPIHVARSIGPENALRTRSAPPSHSWRCSTP